MVVFRSALLFIFAGVSSAYGQITVTVTGPANVTLLATHEYTAEFRNQYGQLITPLEGGVWTAFGGNVMSMGPAFANIKWTSAGLAQVFYEYDDGVNYYFSSLSVSVTSTTPPTPSTSFTFERYCGTTKIIRNSGPSTGIEWHWQTSPSGTTTNATSGNNNITVSSGPLYLRAKSGSTWSANALQVTGLSFISTPPPVPVSAVHGHTITNGSVQVPLSVSSVSGVTSYRWYTPSGSLVTATPSPSYTPIISTTTTYHVASVIDYCESSARRAVTANVYPEPVVVASNEARISAGNQVILSVSNFTYDNYEWFEVNTPGVTGGATFQAGEEGVYKVRVKKGESTWFETPTGLQVWEGLNGQNQNYIVSNTIQIPGVTDVGMIKNLSADANLQTVQYFDGLGRLNQTVSTAMSPQKIDLVQPTVYDGFGRETHRYLPYASGSSGLYKTDFIEQHESGYATSAQNVFYNGSGKNADGGGKPFAETRLESSPLNRILEQGAPGVAWQADQNDGYSSTDRTIKYSYELNGADEVMLWSYILPNSSFPFGIARAHDGSDVSYYAQNELYKTRTKDEEHNETIEYKDKQGKVVLKRVQAPGGEWADTYYIYDDFEQLVTVIPPAAVKLIGDGVSNYHTATDVVKDAFLNRWAFRYTYDERRRMTQKQVPGAQAVYMIYDNRDRVVLTQDGKQRATSPRQWTFTKYDELNRPVLTGIKDTTVILTQDEMQTVVNAFYSKSWNRLYETYIGSAAGNVHGYTNKSYPVITSGSGLNTRTILTVTYYDNYDYLDLWIGEYDYVNDGLSAQANGVIYTQPVAPSDRVIGQATGTKTKVMDAAHTIGATWLKSVIYYDEKYRAIQTISDNYKGGEDRISSLYDFTGKVLHTQTTHVTRDPVWTDIVGVNFIGNKADKADAPSGWGTSGAASADQLEAGQDGWVEAIADGLGTNKMFGLSATNQDAHQQTINFAWYQQSGGTLRVYENGTNKYLASGTLQPGEVLRVERVGTTINYLRNGVILYQSQTASTTPLVVDFALYNYNSNPSQRSALTGLRTSFSTSAQVTKRRFEYDHAGRLLNLYHQVGDGQKVTWGSLVNTTVEGDILTKTGTSTGWNAGAFSQQFIPAGEDGWFEFLAYETGKTRMIGLADQNVNVNYNTIDYAIYLNGSTVNIRENGVDKGNVGTFAASDVFRIERRNGTILFMKNGNVIYTSATPSSTVLYADCSLNALGGKVAHATIGTDTGSSEIAIVMNEYNELGQLVDKKLHSVAGTAPKQSVDYRYNIRGWLTSMNNASLTNDGTRNDDTGDYFGFELGYNESIGIGNSGLFNGNISGMKWSNNLGQGSVKEKGFVYQYDPMNRITSASFKEKTGSWSAVANDAFSVTNYSYDLNGNILGLTRLDERGTNGIMDQLVYHYGSGSTLSNKLLKVTDTGDKAKGFVDGTNTGSDYTYDANGNMITDQNKGITTAITYNFLNLPEIVTKGGNTIQYIYDATGRKLAQVTNFGGRRKQVDYAGEFQYENDQLQIIAHDEGRIVMAGTEVIYLSNGESDVDYTPSNATLSVETIGTEKYVKAVATSTAARSGIESIGGTFPVEAGGRYKIRVKGYRDKGTATASSVAYIAVQGNGNDLVWPGAALPAALATASTESWTEQVVIIPDNVTVLTIGVTWNTGAVGEVMFINEVEVIREKTQNSEYQYHLKDHLGNVRLTFTTKDETETALATYEANNEQHEEEKFLRTENVRKVWSSLVDRTNGASDGYAQRLSGGENERFGLARSIAVMPGDKVSTEVYAKYFDTSSQDPDISSLVAAIIAQLNGTNPSGPVVDGGSFETSTASFPFAGEAGGLTQNDQTTGAPRAYLNWLVFDRDYVLIPQKSGFKRITTAAHDTDGNGGHERIFSPQITIDQPGYVYIYLSNEGETQLEVFFDDFKVEHVKSPVVQMDDYYPFGLTFNSYKRENSVENKIKFQGQEHIDDLNLGWVSFKWRNHMADIGRFFNVDPLAEKYVYNSPYAFSENHVVAHRELEGLEKVSVNKKRTDRMQRATNRELGRRSEGRSPNLSVIPLENTTKTRVESGATGNNFLNGERGEKPVPARMEPFSETRNLEITPFNYSGTAESAGQNIFSGNTVIPKGAVVENAVLNISVEVVDGASPQVITIQQGNFGLDGTPAEGQVLFEINTENIEGVFQTSIPLNNVDPNTNLSIQFTGGTENTVNVTGEIQVNGTKPEERR